MLEKKSTKELRQIIKRLSRAEQGNSDELNRTREHLENTYSSNKKIYHLKCKVNYQLGKRKGLNCPANKQRTEEYNAQRKSDGREIRTRYTTFSCAANEYQHYPKGPFDFYLRCAQCTLTREQAMKKGVFNQVFTPSGN